MIIKGLAVSIQNTECYYLRLLESRSSWRCFSSWLYRLVSCLSRNGTQAPVLQERLTVGLPVPGMVSTEKQNWVPLTVKTLISIGIAIYRNT